MQKLTLVGRIGKDAEVKDLQSGTKVINFSVAHSEKKGENQETIWFDCAKWVNDGQSTAVAQYIKKGGLIYIEGKVSARAYTANDGSSKASLSVTVSHIELLGGGAESSGQAQQPETPKVNSSADLPNDDNSELPF